MRGIGCNNLIINAIKAEDLILLWKREKTRNRESCRFLSRQKDKLYNSLFVDFCRNFLQIKAQTKEKKADMLLDTSAYKVSNWWSRGELNPCPVTSLWRYLHVYSVFVVSRPPALPTDRRLSDCLIWNLARRPMSKVFVPGHCCRPLSQCPSERGRRRQAASAYSSFAVIGLTGD